MGNRSIWFGTIFAYKVMEGNKGIWFSAIREYCRCCFLAWACSLSFFFLILPICLVGMRDSSLHTKHPPLLKTFLKKKWCSLLYKCTEFLTYHRIVFLLFYIYTLNVVFSSIAVVWLTGWHAWSYIYPLYFDKRNIFFIWLRVGQLTGWLCINL